MTTMETIARDLAMIVLLLGSTAVIAALVAELVYRLKRTERMQLLHDLDDQFKRLANEKGVDREERRRDIVEQAEKAFAGVLARDLVRDAELRSVFESVCESLRPSTSTEEPNRPARG